MKTVAPFIAKPMAIDRFIDPRLKARDAVLILFDADVAAGAATGADRRGFVQVPDPHFEAKIAIRQRAHRADIDNIGRERIVEHGVGKKRDGRVIPAMDHRQLVGMGDFLEKTDAAGAFDAALAVEDNVGTEDFPFTLVLLARIEAAVLQIMLHVVILQPALPRLIADRTIEGVVDEQKLHHRFAHGLQLGHLLDLDHAHAAIARNRKFGMITIMRDVDSHLRRGLNDGRPLRSGDLLTVDDDLNRIHKNENLEYWNIGLTEYWLPIAPPFHYSIIPLLHSHRAFLFLDVPFEFVPIFVDKRRRGHGCGVPEWANRIAHDVAADIENEIEIALLAFALLDAAKNFFHPVTAFAARSALPAGLVGEKMCQVPCGANHTGAIVHDDHAAGTEEATRRLNGFVVQVYIFDFFATQHRHRSAAGNHTFELSAIRHPAAILFKKFFEWVPHDQLINARFVDMAADAEEFGAFAFFRAHGRVGSSTMIENPGQRCQRFDIVDDRRTAEEPVGRRKRRFDFWPASAAFK